jgi:hypothetical protein
VEKGYDTQGRVDYGQIPEEQRGINSYASDNDTGSSWLKRAAKPRSPLYTILVLAAIMVAMITYTRGDPRGRVVITPPWQPGEVSVLEIRDSHGQLIAPWELRIDSNGKATLFTSDQHGSTYSEHAMVAADPDTLVPIRTELTYESDHGRIVYAALYGEDGVSIEASVPGQNEESIVELPDTPYFDNEQFIMVIRALPLKRNFKATLKDVITRAAMKTTITLNVAKKEKLEVPAGSFETWKVDLMGTGRTVWIAVPHPHQIVRFEDRKARTTADLVQYTPGVELETGSEFE